MVLQKKWRSLVLHKPYISHISLEVHLQLRCQSKLFCSCPAVFSTQANLNICPICLAYPGTMPSLNQQAPVLAVRLGTALHCEIQSESAFDRKTCYSPDLPKAYQITQNRQPLMIGGYLDLESSRVRLRKAYLEEDSASILPNPASKLPLLDFNRAGIAMLGIVTEADMQEASQALEFLKLLQAMAIHLGVSTGIMEEGTLCFDVHISNGNENKPEGERVVIKNLKSFSYVEIAINYEKMRQMELIKNGKQICNETRVFDQKKMETVLWRNCDNSQDYRYMPEPDLGILLISRDEIRAFSGIEAK
jgi:aspartyl-tRNA(Asn)/glutamyl-tRNA(Gln) amidotransferase subunit B